jgi:5-formyltetrahydrofolate cyclo-ligase
MVESKQELRRMAQCHRRALPLGVDLSAPLTPLLEGARRVASYIAFGAEPSVPARPGWLVPVLLPDGDLDWVEFTGELDGASTGPREPIGPRLGVEAVASCDLVLVPALLVDRQGHRLGKGGGSYDRALARATGFTVALLHDGELVEALPAEEHDVRVLAAATPLEGVVRLPGS